MGSTGRERESAALRGLAVVSVPGALEVAAGQDKTSGYDHLRELLADVAAVPG